MISVAGLAKRFGPQVLFENVTLELVPGQRYGLVGANGSGKSTFLKILTGDESADEGQVTFARQMRLGVLRQDQFAEDEARILDVAMSGEREVYAALRSLEGHEEVSSDRLVELNDFIAQNDGYTLEARAREILVGLGIPSAKLTEPLRTLSGGFKLRVLLAQVLVGRPDILLLDEPTNHLDILSIRWLEGFLSAYKGCAVVISHDRRFLDAVTTRTLDVDYETIIDYVGNYSQFVAAKELSAKQREAEIARAEKIIAEKRAFVERFRAKATKARQAQSRAKQIEKIEVAEVRRSSRRAPLFRFEQERPTGKDVLQVEGLSKSFGERRVLSQVSFQVRRGERIAIIGENGIGKSTLLKILTEYLPADQGSFSWGVHTNIGYFAQDHQDLLADPQLTPLDFIWNRIPQETTSYVRGQLGRMLFTGEEVEKKVGNLSGGEAARLVFTKIAVEKPNVLILDEPTNHLDIESIEALAACLQSYEGTLLFVSHDRWFVSQIATRILELKPDGLHDFPGTYDEYLARDGADHLDVDAVSLKAKKDAAAQASGSGPASTEREASLSYEERKRLSNRLKSLPQKRDALLAQIDELEKQVQAIDAEYADPSFFERTSVEEQKATSERKQSLEAEVAQIVEEWEKIEGEMEELEAKLGAA